ncbi:MAG: phage Gp37/Gp68 family protein [Candidatus Gastranaerophilales bacterium]|nr:phage Gp37/Gp68 family protein [Candidatus Gastranaerophilales bacterium]
MSKTKIQWTNETWNPITGCTKYSDGCQNCYAEKMHKRLTAMRQEKYKEPFNKVIFHAEELTRKFGKKTKMIFVNSMSDTFHKDVTDLKIQLILDECYFNDPHIFQILTKRAERLPNFEYPANVWLGVTVEMAKYKSRMDYLKQTNAKIKFLSCEPLLEDLGELDLTRIDWVIVGGESGKNARPCHPDWVRNIKRQCEEQKVPFFFKQWGGVNKKKTGCLLDGREYKEMPK